MMFCIIIYFWKFFRNMFDNNKNIYYGTTSSDVETKKIGSFLCQQIITELKKTKEKNIILLEGDIGIGKTVFVKGLAKKLGIKDNVNSPTFVLLKTYQGSKYILHHLDLYRILNDNQPKNNLEMEILELLDNTDKGDIIIIESNINIVSFFSVWHYYIRFNFLDNQKRFISIEKNIIEQK